MSTLTAHLCKLMSLPPYLAVNEARSKLSDTFLIVNGKLVYVENINEDRMQILQEGQTDEYVSLRGRDIETLEFWLPISGIYMIEGVPVHLWKLPKRQWRKSFSWNYYASSHGSVNAYKLFDSKPMELYRLKNDLMYYDLAIGRFSGGEVTLTIPEFEFEANLYKEHIRGKV